jgi:hypothetical protein
VPHHVGSEIALDPRVEYIVMIIIGTRERVHESCNMPVSVHQKCNVLSIFAEFGYEMPIVAFLMDTNWHIATLMDSSVQGCFSTCNQV